MYWYNRVDIVCLMVVIMMMCGIVFVVVVILFAWIFVGTWNFRSNSAYLDDVNYALIR